MKRRSYLRRLRKPIRLGRRLLAHVVAPLALVGALIVFIWTALDTYDKE